MELISISTKTCVTCGILDNGLKECSCCNQVYLCHGYCETKHLKMCQEMHMESLFEKHEEMVGASDFVEASEILTEIKTLSMAMDTLTIYTQARLKYVEAMHIYSQAVFDAGLSDASVDADLRSANLVNTDAALAAKALIEDAISLIESTIETIADFQKLLQYKMIRLTALLVGIQSQMVLDIKNTTNLADELLDKYIELCQDYTTDALSSTTVIWKDPLSAFVKLLFLREFGRNELEPDERFPKMVAECKKILIMVSQPEHTQPDYIQPSLKELVITDALSKDQIQSILDLYIMECFVYQKIILANIHQDTTALSNDDVREYINKTITIAEEGHSIAILVEGFQEIVAEFTGILDIISTILK